MRGHETNDAEAGAVQLGGIARRLKASSTPAAFAAGRERMLMALPAVRRSQHRMLLTAAALFALAGSALGWAKQPAPIGYLVSGSSLQIAGQWLAVAANHGPGALRFSEGTRIELHPASKGRVAELTPRGARFVLAFGALHANVVHRPHARWLIEAGPYAINVTGTAFAVAWSVEAERLEVRLFEGSVVVRGPALHEGIRVAAGQRLVAHAQTGGAELSSPSAAAAGAEPQIFPPAAAAVPTQGEPSAPPMAARPNTLAAPRMSPSWSDLLASGNFQRVLASAHARGIEASLRRGTLADLVALSDAARYAGNRALSRRGLLAQRTRFAASADAHAAAFVLGRMADDDGLQAEALHWYDGYLNELPQGSFAAEALGRKLVVVVRGGDVAAARVVAKQYLQRFPQGPHAAYARGLLQRP